MPDRNGNCARLQGLECPVCGNHTRLKIEHKAELDVVDSGIECVIRFNSDPGSPCSCPNCLFDGKLAEFHFGNRLPESTDIVESHRRLSEFVHAKYAQVIHSVGRGTGEIIVYLRRRVSKDHPLRQLTAFRGFLVKVRRMGHTELD